MKIWHKRCKGAITIFLVIIIVSNFALVGVLVDSARQRMARANAEMALDSAASSVLARYDRRIYDLYGLFATEAMDESAAAALLTDYCAQTLGVKQPEQGAMERLYQSDGSVSYFGDMSGAMRFDGYHYDIRVETERFRTLADTQAVTAQIVDHMKYTLPNSMAGGLGEFTESVHTMLSAQELLKLVWEKLDATDPVKRTRCEEASALLATAVPYTVTARDFGAGGPGAGSSFTATAYDPYEPIRGFDSELDAIEEAYDTSFIEDADAAAAMERAKRRAMNEAVETLERAFAALEDGAEVFRQETDAIARDADAWDAALEEYKTRLQSGMDADSLTAERRALYATELTLADAVKTIVTDGMALVRFAQPYAEGAKDALAAANRAALVRGARAVVSTRLGSGGGAYSLFGWVGGAGSDARRARGMVDTAGEAYAEVFSAARGFEPVQPSSVRSVPVNPAGVWSEAKPDTAGLRNALRQEDMQVTFRDAKSAAPWDGKVNRVAADNGSTLLKAGGELLAAVETSLNEPRVSLSVCEYALDQFPNYVQHHSAPLSALAQDDPNRVLIDPKSGYDTYCASHAEVETVISGNPDARQSAAFVAEKLFAMRLAFRLAAAMTDEARVRAAGVQALALAREYAPVVATSLLVQQALEESREDVRLLCAGNAVALCKHGDLARIDYNYPDHLRLLLLYGDADVTVQRMQQLIQANIRHGEDLLAERRIPEEERYALEDACVSFDATLRGSIDFLFLSEAVLPANLKQNGRLPFAVATSVGY